MSTTEGGAAKPQPQANDESRDGGDIQTRDSGDNTLIREDDESYRDGGDIQTRGTDTATGEKEEDAQINSASSSPDDLERGA